MTWFTLAVSSHPDAMQEGTVTQAVSESWEVVLSCPMTAQVAEESTAILASQHGHARCFIGKTIGRLYCQASKGTLNTTSSQ